MSVNPDCPIHGNRAATKRVAGSVPAAKSLNQRILEKRISPKVKSEAKSETAADIKAAVHAKVRAFLSSRPPADDARTPAMRAADETALRANLMPSPTLDSFNTR